MCTTEKIRKIGGYMLNKQTNIFKLKMNRLPSYKKKKTIAITIMAIPALICLFVFNYMPMFGLLVELMKHSDCIMYLKGEVFEYLALFFVITGK
jgi:ABC-type polysaccharide transport system permease subunit